jgi:hypothetical protein
MTDQTSRQRGRPTKKIQQLSENLRAENNIWSQVPEWARHQDILTDRPSVVKWLRLRRDDIFLKIVQNFYGFTALRWTLAGFFNFSLASVSARRIPWTGDRPVYTWQQKHRTSSEIHASSGIRTHDPSVWAGEDSSCGSAAVMTLFPGETDTGTWPSRQ